MGQTIALLGTKDPRLTKYGTVDFRLRRQTRCYAKQDPAPGRVKPIPFPILHHVASRVTGNPNADHATRAKVDMMIIAVFFLMRPGEYCNSTGEAHPFKMEDTRLFSGDRALDIHTASAEELQQASAVHLTFTTQKNAVRGEVIAQGPSGHPFFCPVKAAARRLTHLREQQAPQTTPLHMHRSTRGRLEGVTSKDITRLLRASIQAIGHHYGVQAKETNVRALRATGAMALLNANVDPNAIRLIGRWQSDSMLRYLHAQALPNMHTHAQAMLQGGDFALGPPQHPAQG